MTGPMIVCELSANHRGSLDTALKLVEECAKAGADAIKLQTWTPDTMVLDPALVIKSGPWAGRNMMELYREAHTPWAWHTPLFELAQDLGMIGFSSVFDMQALEFLESINCPMYKISSFDCTDLRLIEAVARTGRPMVISTGMATWDEISQAATWAYARGCKDLTMLKCTSAYPAPLSSCLLHRMKDLEKLQCKIGFSDHTKGRIAATVATALGATMIEKHVMLDSGGLDGDFSITPDELGMLVASCRMAAETISPPRGISGVFGVEVEEQPQAELRKSLYVIKDMHRGELFTPHNIGAARPALGLPCHAYPKLLNRRAKQSIKAGTPMAWNLLI